MTTNKIWISRRINPHFHWVSSLIVAGIWMWFSSTLGPKERHLIGWGYQAGMVVYLFFFVQGFLLRRVSLVGEEVVIEGLGRVTTIQRSQVESVTQPRYLRGCPCTLVYRTEAGERRSLWYPPGPPVEVARQYLCPSQSVEPGGN